jgi:hypothetical protein
MWRGAVALVALTIPLLSVAGAVAQVPPPVPVPTPQFNPSTPLVIPSAPEVPVSPGYGNGIGGSGAAIGGLPNSSIGALPNSSYSIIAPGNTDDAPIRHKRKRHVAVRHPL